MDCDVVVIGAGLAGLNCAITLARNGLTPIVVESRPHPGGRVHTEVLDGFTCDVGFQVLNPAYPAVRRWVDIDALDLRPFGRGLAVRTDDLEGAPATLAVPDLGPAALAALPGQLAAALAATRTLLPARQVPALARWVAPALGPAPRLARPSHDITVAQSLDQAGLQGPTRTLIERFLSGVLLDDTGITSAAFVRLLVRMFLRSAPGLPAAGMAALPAQLAARLPTRVRTQWRATSLDTTADGIRVATDNGRLHARAIVVATDPRSAGTFTRARPPVMKGVATTWFSCPQPPTPSTLLHLDLSAGPVRNTAVMSNVAPYTPRGRHLVQASMLLTDGQPPPRADVREHLARIYGVATRSWEEVTTHVIPDALPSQPVPLRARREVRVRHRVYVCGDHRDTASIQGALVSGYRTAAAVVDDLTGRR